MRIAENGLALKRRLRNRERVFGCWSSLGHPSITEIFAKSGADFTTVDMEHTSITHPEAQRMIAAAQAQGVVGLARASSHNAEQIRRLLDSGADGILIPNVSKEEEVRKIAEWIFYPTAGKRGFGVARAQGYGLEFSRYTSEWNRRAILILQIESVEGVEACDRLLAHPAVDGVMVGPYDISGSLGLPGQLEHPRVVEACTRVVDAARRCRKACGTQIVEPTPDNVAAALASGYTFVVLASDIFLLWKWSERMRECVRMLRGTAAHAAGPTVAPG
jgi:2-dehydro-3-deoxyglucarate aldolase